MKAKKIISVAICLLLLLQTFSVNVFANSGEDTPVVFEDAFNYDSFGTAVKFYDSTNTWQAEFNDQSSTTAYGYRDSTPPTVAGGALNFVEGDGVRLNWQKLDGFSTFDASKTYTITFDVKITDFGDNDTIGGVAAWNRDFYFAPAGYFNQIEMRTGNAGSATEKVGMRAGDSWVEASKIVLNKVYGCTVVWSPSAGTITTTIKDGSTVVVTGSRTNNDYKTLNKYTCSWVWRCEDGAAVVDNITFSDGSKTYSQNFDVTAGSMSESGIWGIENVQVSGSLSPVLDNGILKLSTKTGIRFNWTQVPGVSAFNSTNIYTFDFDLKITDSGNGNIWGSGPHYTRSLYVGFGGWYTLLSMPDKDNAIDMCYGAGKVDWSDATYLNKDMHVTFIWSGNSVYGQITDAAGNVIVSGTRTSNDFTNMTAENAAMTNLVLRCEDGAIEIDNFRFSEEKPRTLESKVINIPAFKQGIYTAEMEYSGVGNLSVKLGTKSLFEISPSSMTVCTKGINGSFGEGTYKIKANINPEQKMVAVEITAPDGAVVRRAFYALLESNSLDSVSVHTTSSENKLKSSSVTYKNVVLNSYNLTSTEPTYSGVEANIYNVVTSFNDAQTTRNFAWTVKASFVGSSEVALKYRVKGTTEWTVVDGIKEAEEYTVSDEDYYKCDISGLSANTEYEYKIGIKGSTDEANKWSKTYTFKTAAENITDFSFIAIGDTQGLTWNGLTDGDKGFMFAKAAYDEAFEEISDPAFIMHTGDVSEWGGAKNLWNMYFKSLSGYGTSTPLFATMGNHDTWLYNSQYSGNDGNLYFDYHFNHPNNGGTAALDMSQLAGITDQTINYIAANADETIYSYDYGNVHFISLNSGAFNHSTDSALLRAQYDWLEADLEANKDAEWIIIFQHQPVYHRLGGESDRGNDIYSDLIEAYGVDLVIQGHSHLVTRSYPMKDGEIATKELTDNIPKGTGTIYTTIGSCALNHDGITDSSNVEEMFSIAIPTAQQAAYTTVSISGGDLIVTTKQLNGLVLDQFTIASLDSGDGDGGDDDFQGGDFGGGNNDPVNPNPDENGSGTTDPNPDENGGGNTDTDPDENTTPDNTDKTDDKTDDKTEDKTDGKTDEKSEAPASSGADEDKGGCGSTLSVGAALVIAVISFGAATVKKRE